VVHHTGEGLYEAELYRLYGELLRAHASTPSTLERAEGSLQQALAIARQQQAKSWELRAALSLGGCGSSRASGLRRVPCWRRSTTGSPRALTPPTSKRPRHCWTRWHEGRCGLGGARARTGRMGAGIQEERGEGLSRLWEVDNPVFPQVRHGRPPSHHRRGESGGGRLLLPAGHTAMQ
jgi:hypothetical protein